MSRAERTFKAIAEEEEEEGGFNFNFQYTFRCCRVDLCGYNVEEIGWTLTVGSQ